MTDLVFEHCRHPGATTMHRLAVVDGRFAAEPVQGATVVDLAGRVVVPGLINCHVHLTEPVWRGRRPAVEHAFADLALARGFTTILDLGSDPRVTHRLRRAASHGDLCAPDILTAGLPLYPHRAIPFYVRSAVPRWQRPFLADPATPALAERIVRRQLAAGAATTKLFTGSYVAPNRVVHMEPTIARAAVAASHDAGCPVFAHCSDRIGLEVALESAVDVLAHVPDTTGGTENLLRDAARDGRSMVPTLAMFAHTVSSDDAYLGPLRESVRTFVAAGGRILFGTDVGYDQVRDPTDEVEALLACGLTKEDVLAAATSSARAALGLPVNELRPGDPADLVVLERWERPSDLIRPAAVVRAGRLVWRSHTFPWGV